MAFEDLFGTWTVKNQELKSVADFANECAVNTAKEQSAGMTIGLNEHAMTRQAGWIKNIASRVESLAQRPIPDLPATHPVGFEVDHAPSPELITVDGKDLNSDATAVCSMWQTIAYELVKSNSAGLGGGLTSFDATRTRSNVASLEQFLLAVQDAGDVDFPETAAPEAQFAVKAKKK